MLHLSINNPSALGMICHALATPLRIDIVRLLDKQVLSCAEISKELGYPMSTISTNIKVLEEAGLITSDLLPAKNGSRKMCSLVYDEVYIRLAHNMRQKEVNTSYEAETPIGNYMDFRVEPSCGLVIDSQDIEALDNPNQFLLPDRVNAQLLWFRKGYVEYRIPLNDTRLTPKSITFEMELCSEAPGFNSKMKSDITLWINHVEIGTWTSPADFGDRKGKYTPDYWEMGSTQYGLLTNWTVTPDGALLNGDPVSDICISDLALGAQSYVTMRIGVKDDAKNVGGINLFGDKFGDYPQSIRMYVYYNEN